MKASSIAFVLSVFFVSTIIISTIVFAGQAVYSIDVEQPVPGSNVINPVDITGIWHVSAPQGNIEQYNVQINWGDGTVVDIVNINRTEAGETQQTQEFFGNFSTLVLTDCDSDDGEDNCNVGLLSHTYGGEYLCQQTDVTVKLYHSTPPGTESSGDAQVNFILIPGIDEICDNDIDDDCDGLVDCDDPDCDGDPACPVQVCGNGIVETGEDCDPGEDVSGDCCDATCHYETSSYTCRDSVGVCDMPEQCTGSSALCPEDSFMSSSTVCRSGSGDLCDPDETCTGTDASCPADQISPAGMVCNYGSGDMCDPDETCTGVAGEACPVDSIMPYMTVCRSGSGDLCDPDEMCTGIEDMPCPEDNVASSDTECRQAAGICDVAETCTGVVGQTCPTDSFLSSSTVCRVSAGDCDLTEMCTGSSADCPDDAFVPQGTLCLDGSYCNGEEKCDGFGVCQSGSAVSCISNDISEIATCFNTPDGNDYTWDSRNPFTSICVDDDENTGHCTTGDDTVTSACDYEQCNAECDETHACDDSSCEETYDDYCDGFVLTEYDSDKIKDSTTVSDSCPNTCLGDCTCTDCDTDCSAPATSTYCVKDVCDAECDSDDDCDVTDCDYLDGCYGKDYYDYSDAENTCLGDCSCTVNSCTSPSISQNDARCTECQTDSDCDSKDRDYCVGTAVKHDEGRCVDYECSVETTTVQECDDTLWCNGDETCSNAACVSGTAPNVDDGVDCTIDSCDEANDVIINTPDDSYCDNGLWCDGQETCDISLGCQAGTAIDCSDDLFCTVDEYCDDDSDSCAFSPRDCSGNNIEGIATCNNDPDNNPFTWDYRSAFESSCDDENDVCTVGDSEISYTCHDCDLTDGIGTSLEERCCAECDQDSDCVQSTGYCDYENMTYCSRDSYGTCGDDCGCIDDAWSCDASEYCLYCDHCGDGEVNCGEDCEVGDQGDRCLPEGASIFTCINGDSYETPEFDVCTQTCEWDGCTQIITKNDTRCVMPDGPVCDNCGNSVPEIEIPTFNIQMPKFTVPTFSFTKPSFDFSKTVFKIPSITFSSFLRR
ncbi:MAG: hypothetical protein JW700_03245 [Candidatus Aenigmarchaeota archaeon]|nr:hypothetical protein [Candidatus Aenigmarchaeota archaeon]